MKVIKNGEKINKWSTEHEIHNFSYKYMFLFTVKSLLIKICLSTCYLSATQIHALCVVAQMSLNLRFTLCLHISFMF